MRLALAILEHARAPVPTAPEPNVRVAGGASFQSGAARPTFSSNPRQAAKTVAGRDRGGRFPGWSGRPVNFPGQRDSAGLVQLSAFRQSTARARIVPHRPAQPHRGIGVGSLHSEQLVALNLHPPRALQAAAVVRRGLNS